MHFRGRRPIVSAEGVLSLSLSLAHAAARHGRVRRLESRSPRRGSGPFRAATPTRSRALRRLSRSREEGGTWAVYFEAFTKQREGRPFFRQPANLPFLLSNYKFEYCNFLKLCLCFYSQILTRFVCEVVVIRSHWIFCSSTTWFLLGLGVRIFHVLSVACKIH